MTWIILFTLFKAIFWSQVLPLWHFPDEQAHFGHVAFLVESGRADLGKPNDLNEEIAVSEQRLGTFRDEHGNNRFTFHPEYRIEYTDTYTGVYEQEIISLPESTRTNFVAKESAYYPHFFYKVSGLIYKLFYNSNLFIRVFSLRLFWLWLQLILIWLVWQISQMVFPKNRLLVYAATAITALQPMFSFVGSGLTSDNLHNLLFTAVIYFCLRLIHKHRWQSILGLVVSLTIGLITKQQFMIAFLVALPVVVYVLMKNKKLLAPFFGIFAFGLILSLILAPDHLRTLVNALKDGRIPYLAVGRNVNVRRTDYGFGEHIIWTVTHTFREVLPWYWGVFNWLGVVLPRWVNRVFMRLLVVAGVGLVIRVIQIIKAKKVGREDWNLIFLTWAATVYYLVLMIWDYFHVRSSGFPFGMQGRYYFPVIVSHMILLVVGINALAEAIGKLIKKDIVKLVIWLLIIWFVIAQLVGIYTVASAYYDLSTFNTFIIQASQYKPWFAKGGWLIGSLVLYLGSLFALVYGLKNEK